MSNMKSSFAHVANRQNLHVPTFKRIARNITAMSERDGQIPDFPARSIDNTANLWMLFEE